MLRVAATDAAHRQGALFFNPGGPGQDGLATPVEFFQIFAGSDPAHSQGALQLRLLAEFDLIGFSPRGTGDSTALTCVTPLRERAVDYSPAGLAAQNLESAFFNLATIAEACHRNPLTPFISSDTTARDMDLLRAVLGEQRVNYFGVPYGTWLGAWYASLFPDRVGRMLLDSSWDFGSTMEHNFNQHPKSFHRVLDEVLLPYATRHPEAFGLGTSTASLRTALLGLPDPLLDVLSLPLFELSYYAWDAERHLDHIKAALVLQRLMEPGEPSDEGRVRQGIEDSVFVAGDVQRDQAIREVAHAVFDSYVQRWLAPPPPKSLTQDPMASTYWAVRCNDTPSTRDRAYWVDLLHTLAPDYPLFYSVLLDNPCPFWTTGGVQKPPITPMQKLDILLVQSQFDAPTPKEGADALFAALPAAHRVYVPG
ncbi:alpha/beta fold hydrolase [Xenophilus sp. Marseille-Q4582]|uniref:alpha/beta fold hydrolase n=1 Tax=Xenophilus sp. Marseille-Q4582 TaxID=2866600 RepID=UPI001CE4B039|nr:alpha/beta fold hydrolase [Xenophilus sp. Marseille-Q4582]